MSEVPRRVGLVSLATARCLPATIFVAEAAGAGEELLGSLRLRDGMSASPATLTIGRNELLVDALGFALDVPLRAIARVECEDRVLGTSILVTIPRGVLRVRCLGASRFAEELRRAARGSWPS